MSAPAYRCTACSTVTRRCTACAARRRVARQREREQRRELGRCIDCRRKAAFGQLRCVRHRRDNLERTIASQRRKLTA